MTKIKRRELEVHTVNTKTKNNVQKCVVKLKRLGRGTSTKIDNFSYKKHQDEPVSVLYSSSSEEDILEEEIVETKSQKFKNCVVRLKRDLLQMAHHVKGGKSVTEKKPTPLPISYPNSDSSTSARIENLSKSPKAAPKSPVKVISPEHFMAPPNSLRNLPNKHSRRKKQKSREVRTKPNENDVYEFPTQSSISEKEDPTSEIVQQLIKHGKVSVAKHLKNRGRPKLNKKKAAPKPANRKINKKSEERVKEPRKVELPEKICVNVNSSPRDVHPIERIAENEPPQTHQRTPVTDKRKLLEVARNFIEQSTPIRKQTAVPIGSPFSPIAIKSPWRPMENTVLPRVFYFSRNEDNLPSYSSDVIASSQVEKRRSVLNHSDIENVNPNNEALSNNNPRKTLGHRSPLKSINILEVVNLPRKSAINKDPKSFVHPLACNNSPLITNKSTLRDYDVTQPSRDFDPEKLSIDNCFGFDDCPENPVEEKSTVVPDKSQLKMRLKQLQNLLPQKPNRRSTEKVKTIFPKQAIQKDIRDVLTSTFQENKNLTNASNVYFDSSIDISAIREAEDQSNSNVHLFDDLDEDKPSDSTAHLRTYIREKRRRHSFLPSEEEEEEEVEVQEVQKKKRTKTTDAKSIKELKKFVKEFNSICEEVNQYQLHIEKECC